MDFKDQIKQLADRIEKLKDSIQTEEATKNAFIMPFMQSLGYDVFNPLEVVPEFTCDIGTKKGEKIDYAILKDNLPTILIECKNWTQNLDLHDNQLLRYFNVSNAKFGILTNGITYKFYTDLVKDNVMDEVPFLEIDITNIKDNQIEELKKFHKSYFDIAKILDTATDLKYTSEIKSLIQSEISNPSEQFVRLFAKPVYSGSLNQKMIEYFSTLVKKSFTTLISDIISERLQTALNSENIKGESVQAQEVETEGNNVDTSSKTNTTDEEIEGFHLIKALIGKHIDPARITYKDNQFYFAIIIDGPRKTVCRLYLNSKKKYLALFDDEKKEVKYQINELYDIYQYEQALIDRALLLAPNNNE